MRRLILIFIVFLPLVSFGQKIGNISDGESGFSVRGKLNQVIDSVNTYEDSIKSDIGVFRDSIFINDGWITGIDDSGNVTADTLFLGPNPDTLTEALEFDDAFPDALNSQGALRGLSEVYNNTGVTIPKGTPVYFTGSVGDTIPTIDFCSANIPQAKFVQGFTFEDIPNNTAGHLIFRGKLIGIDGSGLFGPVYLSNDSSYTGIPPAYPSERVILGGVISNNATTGEIQVEVNLGFVRDIVTRSYSFTSLSVTAGTFYKAGFYDAPSADANLTQASTTVTYGTADIAYHAHPFAVVGSPGSVTGGGRVALITTGTRLDDFGVQTASFVDTLITDITSVLTNEYYETAKYLGTVTYQLVVVEGSPSAYSLDFNYGYAKYEDANNLDFYLGGVECVWRGDGTDAIGFDIEVLHHKATGWTYSATAFEPGNGVIAQRSVDQAGFLRVTNNSEAAWKRSNISTFIDGDASEGVLFRITTGASSTIQTMDIHAIIALD